MVEKNVHSDDDIVPEEGVSEGTDELELEVEEELSAAKMKQLREKLRACEKEKQEHLDGWQRARADFLNYKRRTEEDAKRQSELGTARTVESLLPLLDSFALATKGKTWDEADQNFKAGFQMIQSQLGSILRDMRVEAIDPLGATFNPHIHEAMAEVEVDDAAKVGTIIETIQPGYQIGDTVIRAARVVVGK